MSKKDYIDAVNEIEVNEKVKKETLNKINSKKEKRRYNRVYPIASLALMCAIIMAVILPNKTIAPIHKEDEKTQETIELPKVENFENLYAMLKEKAKDEMKGIYDLNYDSMEKFQTTNSTNRVEEEKEFSSTNIQVQGVDEADIVKTDGKYIYYLTNEKLSIVEVNEPGKMNLKPQIEFKDNEFFPREMFLKDDKLIVIGTTSREVETEKENKNEDESSIARSRYYLNYKSYTVARVYDIKNKTNPALDRSVEVEGNYISSRMINNNVYLISNRYIYGYLCKEHPIEELNEKYFTVQYVDTAVENKVREKSFDCLYYLPGFEDTSYLNIAAFNIANNEPANIASYLGAGNNVYASNVNLYITRTKTELVEKEDDLKIETEIYKFKLNDANCIFETKGTVPGMVLNQFSMDENNGYFRIATTDGLTWRDENSTNNLYVLNEKLETIGKIEGLAKGEKIYSVRFMGNRAYMVTFVETDPLFVIDLSTPTAPKVLGELKIPGYSKYLHPYDETHLIGLGEDTKTVNYGYGDQVVTNGMKMSLFDVTDPNNPIEMYSEKIGSKGTYSEALNNHKALLFSKQKNIIAFPITMQGNFGKVYQGAIVYELSLDKGFKQKGKITNEENATYKYYSEKRVDRIIYIGDTLYTLSRNVVKATDLNSMETIGKVDI